MVLSMKDFSTELPLHSDIQRTVFIYKWNNLRCLFYFASGSISN